MENQDNSFGLRPLRMRDGRPWNGAVTKYYVPSTYATAIFRGDAVVKTGTANTAVITSGTERHEIGTLQEVNRATVGDDNPIVGVVVGVEALKTDLDTMYSKASTENVLLVADDPDLVFEIQADGTLGAASVGLNAVLIDTNSGDTVTGISGTELDTTSDAPEANASNQLLIVGISKDPENNDVASANVNVEVIISRHQNRPIDGILGA